MISNKCYYGLKAMLELALRHGGGKPVTIGEIAEAQRIPVRFLEAILRQLKQGGLAESTRGKEGGYFLAKAANRITVGQVIRLIDGPLVGVNALQGKEGHAGHHQEDPFADIWQRADKAIAAVYDHATFSSIVDREHERVAGQASNFSI